MKDVSLNFRADRLDVAGLARVGGSIKGQVALQKYERLKLDSCRHEADLGDEFTVNWQAIGELRSIAGNTSETWLHLKADGKIPQICQRCLAEVATQLEVERSYRFVADEATASALDDSCEEDLLVLSREFNLSELIEDELLMALPLVAMHETCPEQPKMSVIDADFEQQLQEKPNPFAALEVLKSKKLP
ncbi:MAG TPA: DUF177 domain-containing protein [Burkholderiaceae bacterium]|nr:DUF177 domain-containing protein [Burkholderiaceae bacterium]